jgi:hypothetical protein
MESRPDPSVRETRVTKDKLLDVIRSNREKHIREYEDSVRDYKVVALEAIEQAMERLKRTVNELKEGECVALNHVTFNLRVPENHQTDYDQVIKMLEMSEDTIFTIRADEFAKYVMDDWAWKEEFYGTAHLNKVAATAARHNL